jgi:hypothetical protein
MKTLKNKLIGAAATIFILLYTAGAFGYDPSSSGGLLPRDMVIKDTYKPGLGSPVGKVVLVQGEVVMMHADDMTTGYMAERNLPLYKGDTIVTREKGRIRLKLNDGSILTLASGTKLVLTRSVYDPKRKTRSSFLGLSIGKVRCWVTKLANYKQSQFRVKTLTAVVGVRGSDFIIKVTKVNPYITEVITFKETRLEVAGKIDPEKPVLLNDFEKIMVQEGALPSEIEKVSPEEAEKYTKDFTMLDAEEGPEGGPAREIENAGKILVSDDELVDPDETKELVEPEEPPEPDVFEKEEITGDEKYVEEQQEVIYEEIHEMEEEITELPSMPGTPE